MIQKIILGTLITGDTKNIDLIRLEYFQDNDDRFIFQIVEKLVATDREVDMLTVDMWASKKRNITRHISELTNHSIHDSLTKAHIEQLKNSYINREAKKMLDAESFKINNNNLDIDELYEKVSKLKDVNDSDIDDLYGFKEIKEYHSIIDDAKFIPTGIEDLDEILNDLKCEDLTLVSGNRGEGKTTFCNQTGINAIDKGFPVLFINGEFTTDVLVNNLYTMMIGLEEKYFNYRKYNKKFIKEPKPHVSKAIQEWHKNKLFVYSKSDGKLRTHDQLFKLIESKIIKHKLKFVIVDNLMSLLAVNNAAEKNEAQGDFIKKLVSIGHKYKCHIFLVAHPNKGADKGKTFSANSISGTGDLGNNAANILMIVREYDKEKISEGIHGWVVIDKNRHWGTETKIQLYFDEKRRAYCGFCDEKPIAIVPNWKKYLPKEIKNWNGTTQEFKNGEVGK